jgi:hypothetical protein
MIARVAEMERSIARLSEIRPIVGDFTSLVAESRKTAREVRAALDGAERLLAKAPPPEETQRTLDKVERLTTSSLPVLDRVQNILVMLDTLVPNDPTTSTRTLAHLEERADGLMRRAALYLIGVGAIWSILFWTAYTAGKLLLLRHRARGRRGGARRYPPLDRAAPHAP